MSFENWIVAGAIVCALLYLARRGYVRYKKEAQQIQACQSCQIMRDRRESEPKPHRGSTAE